MATSLAPLALLEAALSIVKLASRTENALVDCDKSEFTPGQCIPSEATELKVPFFLYNPAMFSLYANCDHTTFGNTKHSNALYFTP